MELKKYKAGYENMDDVCIGKEIYAKDDDEAIQKAYKFARVNSKEDYSISLESIVNPEGKMIWYNGVRRNDEPPYNPGW